MQYFLEIAIGAAPWSAPNDEEQRVAEFVGEDLLCLNGQLHVKLSGRQFDRVTKAFRERGLNHLIGGLVNQADPDHEVVAAVIAKPSKMWLRADYYISHQLANSPGRLPAPETLSAS